MLTFYPALVRHLHLFVGVGLLALGGCRAAAPTPTPAVAPPAETATVPSPTNPPEATTPATPLPPTPIPLRPIPAGSPLPEATVADYLETFLTGGLSDLQTVTARIVDAGDTRFVAVYLELLRARQLGLVFGDYRDYLAALESLSGQMLGDNWPAWVEWYGQTDLTPPPGFTAWKGRLLARLDPSYRTLISGEFPAVIRVEEIQWGGVALDGIPALDNPTHIPAAEADYLTPQEVVFGLSINGDNRAYPLRIMDWHEMANDVVGGVPVSLAYCTLCGAAIAYDGRGPDGVTYTFGSSGFLYRSNKLMYDRQTFTLWNQLTGAPVLGKLVGSDLELALLPVVLTTWEAWQAQHPDTQVLSLETGYFRPYEPGAAYADYFAASDTMFPVWQRDRSLFAKEHVYALRLDGTPKAYPLTQLEAEGVINDQIGETPLVVVMAGRRLFVDGNSARGGQYTYSNGGEVRAYGRGAEQFTPGASAGSVIDDAGRVWQVTEEALLGPDGARRERLPGHLAYWFGWYAFYPETLVYGRP